MQWTLSLYSALAVLAQPLVRRKLRRRGQNEPGYLHAVEERFGQYTQTPYSAHEVRPLWVHAVSLGETRVAAVLIDALREEWARRGWAFRLLLTHSTATGREQGASLLQAHDQQVWFPWDTPHAVNAFLQHFQPALGLIIETEVWPNVSALCQRHRIPLALVNARMSEKSYRSASRLRWLSRPAYSALSAVWAQTTEDAERLMQLGSAPAHTHVMGNLKFDMQPNAAQCQQARTERQIWNAQHTPHQPLVVMLASSREGEEASWLASFQGLRERFEGVQWLIVPRHPQRFEAVAQLLQEAHCQVRKRSTHQENFLPPISHPSTTTVLLGDSLGEMAYYYSLSDLALLGGSFEPLGGQNLIEAAACACPVIMGEHTFNFAQAAQWAEQAQAARRVSNMHEALHAVLHYGAHPSELQHLQTQALAFAQSHRGAAQRMAQAAALMHAHHGITP